MRQRQVAAGSALGPFGRCPGSRAAAGRPRGSCGRVRRPTGASGRRHGHPVVVRRDERAEKGNYWRSIPLVVVAVVVVMAVVAVAIAKSRQQQKKQPHSHYDCRRHPAVSARSALAAEVRPSDVVRIGANVMETAGPDGQRK